MDNQNKPPKQYRGTRGLSIAIVIGVAIGTVIGKLMNNMNTGLMLGLVLGVLGWTLLSNRRPGSSEEAADPESEYVQETDKTDAKS